MFRRALHIYTVHVKPNAPLEREAPVFVREGFSVGAFLFTLIPLWPLYHRLWRIVAFVIAFGALVAFARAQGWIGEPGGMALMLGLQLFAGLEGNDWRRQSLKKRGWITAGIVTGESRLRAEQRFLDQYLVGA